MRHASYRKHSNDNKKQCTCFRMAHVRQLTERIVADALRFLYDIPVQPRPPALALPLGELSPKVTERALHAPTYVFVSHLCTPFPIFLRHTRAAPPSPLALPLGELSPKVTERTLPRANICVRKSPMHPVSYILTTYPRSPGLPLGSPSGRAEIGRAHV